MLCAIDKNGEIAPGSLGAFTEEFIKKEYPDHDCIKTKGKIPDDFVDGEYRAVKSDDDYVLVKKEGAELTAVREAKKPVESDVRKALRALKPGPETEPMKTIIKFLQEGLK